MITDFAQDLLTNEFNGIFTDYRVAFPNPYGPPLTPDIFEYNLV